MTIREQIHALVKEAGELWEMLREFFDALVKTVAMIGYIIVEAYDNLRIRMYAVRRYARKLYHRRRKGRW